MMSAQVGVLSDVAAGEHLPRNLVDDLERVVSAGIHTLADLGDTLRGELTARRLGRLGRKSPPGVGDLDLVSTLHRRRGLSRVLLLPVARALLELTSLVGA